MKKLTFIMAITFAIIFSSPAYAATVDFEDLTLGTTYEVPDLINTGGIVLEGVPFQWSSGIYTSEGFARVSNSGMAGGSGNELEVNNISLLYVPVNPIPGLTLDFGEYGGNLNIDINNDFRNFDNFAEIDGLVIGGVTVSVTNGLGNDTGILSLSGTINSFTIGGQELGIDNLSTVPVPGAALLLLSGIIGVLGLKRKNNF